MQLKFFFQLKNHFFSIFNKIQNNLKQIILLAKENLTRRQFVLLSSLLVGISSGFVAVSLKIVVHQIFEWAINNKYGDYKYFFAILPIIGITLTTLIIRYFFKNKFERGLAQVHYSIAKKSSYMSRKNMYDQYLTSALTVGFGGSTGLEAPIVITGAAFGSNYAKTYGFTYKERTLMLACGIAAGIAAAFNAPIAGVLFAIEVLMVDISISAFTLLIIAAASGAIMSNIILNNGILLTFKLTEKFNYVNVPFYLILGVLAGFTSLYHAKAFLYTEKLISRKITNDWIKIIVAGTLLAILTVSFPPLFGEGFQSIKTLADVGISKLLENSIFFGETTSEITLIFLVFIVMILKSIATALTIGGGGNGGNFAPSLFIGAYLGFLTSKLINLTGLTYVPESNFTLVGMAGILSGLYHAPLTALFLIAEITGGYDLIVPLMIVSSISYAISKAFETYSMDTKKLAEKGQVFTADKDHNVIVALSMNDIIERDIPVFKPTDNGLKIVEIVLGRKESIFPVVDDENNLIGLISMEEIIQRSIKNENFSEFIANDIMMSPRRVVDYDINIHTLLSEMEKRNEWMYPVIKNGKYMGFVTKWTLFHKYRNKLKEITLQ